MKHILIIYHSQSGNTAKLADAVFQGACSEADVGVSLKLAAEATLDDLRTCHGVLFGTPENFGYMSGMLKDFFDRTYYPAQPLALNLPYALFVSAGNDGSGAVRQIQRILSGYPMREVAPPVIIRGEPSLEALQTCKELGQTLAAGVAFGIF